MRPLFHPAAEDISVEGILHALADPVRVRILAGIMKASCAQSCSAFLEVDDRSIPKSTLSQHFKVLREAGLIRSERVGVEMHNTPRQDDVQPRFGALLTAIMDAHAKQLARSQRAERARHRKAA